MKEQLFEGENLFIDIDGQNQAIDSWVEYQDAGGTWHSVDLSGAYSSPFTDFTAPQDGEFFIRLQTDGNYFDSDYELLMTIMEGSASDGAQNHNDVELTISNASGDTTVVTLENINVNGDFDSAHTLSDLIAQGLQIDTM